jgi:hypothetical protein
MRSHFSGKGTAESILHFLETAAVRKRLLSAMRPTESKFLAWSACDYNRDCQRVLIAQKPGPQCVFHDINDELSHDARQRLDALEPGPNYELNDKGDRYSAMADVLLRGGCIDDEAVAECKLHRKRCRVFPAEESVDDEDDYKIKIEIAGTDCRHHSVRGNHAGWAGPSARPFWIWVADIRKWRPAIVLHELTKHNHGLLEKLHSALADLYEIVPIDAPCPSRLGFPSTRERSITFMFLRNSVVFMGSSADFWRLCARSVNISSEVFFMDVAGELRCRQDAAARHHFHHPEGQVPKLEHVLTTPQFDRFQKYMIKSKSHCSLDGTFVCDVDQEPQFCTSGALWPCLVSHGTLLLANKEKLASGKDHLGVMGDC